MSISNAAIFTVCFNVRNKETEGIFLSDTLFKSAKLNLFDTVVALQKEEAETEAVKQYPENYRRFDFEIGKWEAAYLKLDEVISLGLKKAFKKKNFVRFSITPTWLDTYISDFGASKLKTCNSYGTPYLVETFVWKESKEILKSLHEAKDLWLCKENKESIEILACTNDERETYYNLGFSEY